MLSRTTKVAMLLAMFSLAFSLVCPVAVTPIFVTNHHQTPTVYLAFPAALLAVLPPPVETAQAHEIVSTSVMDAPDLTYALRC